MIGSELGFACQQIAPIGLFWGKICDPLALPFFIGLSLFLQVTRTGKKIWMGSKFGKI